MGEKTGLAELRALLDVAGLPELGPGPRAGVLRMSELTPVLRPVFAKRQLFTDEQALVRALVLLWHDDMDAAHILAQGVDTPDGSFVHGIIHRREPDFGNASYWFQRVGEHDCYPTLAERVGELLAAKKQDALKAGLLPDGKWDPFAFIRLCEKASTNTEGLLREIQGIESEVLLEYLLGE